MAEPIAATLTAWAAGLSFADLPKAVVADARLRILERLGIIRAAARSPTANAAPRAGLGGSGGDLVLGVAIGNEIGCRLGLVARGAFHDHGLHPTSVLGTPAAAMIAGRRLGLSAAQITSAVGISASQGSGMLEACSDGIWSKTLHPSGAGHAGIVAATLAREGFIGPTSGLDGTNRQFCGHEQQRDYPFDFTAATTGQSASAAYSASPVPTGGCSRWPSTRRLAPERGVSPARGSRLSSARAAGVFPPGRIAAMIALCRRIADLPTTDALLEAHA